MQVPPNYLSGFFGRLPVYCKIKAAWKHGFDREGLYLYSRTHPCSQNYIVLLR